MTQLELINTFAECFENLQRYNFPIEFDKIDTQIHLIDKKVNYFGICRKRYIKGSYYYTIGINKNFALYGTKKAVTNTIYHELLHCLKDSKGHDKVWKMYASQVKTLFGYNIQRLSGDKTLHDCNLLH